MHRIEQQICRSDVCFQSSLSSLSVVLYIGPVWMWLCVGLDEDLTNAVTKHACVSLWWHWSTVLVNCNVFRTWLMCFLLTPVTHMCGGCCVLVIKSVSRCSACLKKYPQKSSFSFGMADEKWQDDVRLKCSLFWFLGLFLSERTDAPMQKKRRLVQ